MTNKSTSSLSKKTIIRGYAKYGSKVYGNIKYGLRRPDVLKKPKTKPLRKPKKPRKKPVNYADNVNRASLYKNIGF